MRDKELKKRTDKELREWYKGSGICISCGQEWAEPGHVYCKKCNAKMKACHEASRDKRIEYKRKQRSERIREGLCTECGKPATEGMRMCPRCRAKRNDSTRKYKIKKKIERETEKARAKGVQTWGR